jgi:hypothetical protein
MKSLDQMTANETVDKTKKQEWENIRMLDLFVQGDRPAGVPTIRKAETI